ncbi:hypothetical protein AVEN_6031-1 [Araneus ventricosus]|uniref:Uncharacterized protein n=1 Tax=Araneus ventricosus TaxID=182803 RepID=A0A4Y2HS78_ARAVE|nr:hypothetical protein AVEN_6031-1 [Araneus ventricosus]
MWRAVAVFRTSVRDARLVPQNLAGASKSVRRTSQFETYDKSTLGRSRNGARVPDLPDRGARPAVRGGPCPLNRLGCRNGIRHGGMGRRSVRGTSVMKLVSNFLQIIIYQLQLNTPYKNFPRRDTKFPPVPPLEKGPQNNLAPVASYCQNPPLVARKVEKGGAGASSSSDQGSKLRGPPQIDTHVASERGVNIIKLNSCVL